MPVIGRRILTAIIALALLVGATIAFILATVNTDTTITIGTGAKGSLSNITAERMADGLTRAGFQVEIVTTDRTLDLIENLADPDNPIDITFIAEEVDARRFPTVDSLGTVARNPFFFAALPGAQGIDAMPETRGAVIDIGPKGSVREAFAREVLAQFNVDDGNTTLLNLPATASRLELETAGVQIVAARWDDPRAYIRQMVADGALMLIPIPEAQALSDVIRSAQAVEIPYAGLSITPPSPKEPLPTIAQLMTVVADDGLSPAAAYAVAEELTIDFSPGTQFSEPGEFPNFTDRQLPVNAYAADFYATGTIPWQFEHLPPLLADSFVNLIVLGTAILLIASIYSLFLPEAYSLWTGIIKPRSEERYINAMEAALASGRDLTVKQRKRLSEILERQDSERVLRQRADNLRPQLSTPVEEEPA